MPSLISFVFAATLAAAPTLSYHVMGSDPGSWPSILSSIGLHDSPTGDVLVIPAGAQVSLEECQSRLARIGAGAGAR